MLAGTTTTSFLRTGCRAVSPLNPVAILRSPICYCPQPARAGQQCPPAKQQPGSGPAPLQSLKAARAFASTPTRARARPAPIAPPPAKPSPTTLDWNMFFQLRKSRRWYQLTSSFVGLSVCFGGGGYLLLNGALDPIIGYIPLDQLITMGLLAVSFAALGWLLGPTVGNQVFYFTNSSWKTQMVQKEKEFFARIKRNRVDPSSSGTGNPVPDFYGEKIKSVADYRQWLRDQRAFNKKRTSFV